MKLVEPWNDAPISLSSFVSGASSLSEVEAKLAKAGLHSMTTPGLGAVAMTLNCDHSEVQGRWGAVVCKEPASSHLVIAFERPGDLSYLQLDMAGAVLEGLHCSEGSDIIEGRGLPFVFLPCDNSDRLPASIREEIKELFQNPQKFRNSNTSSVCSGPAISGCEELHPYDIYLWLAVSIFKALDKVFTDHKRSPEMNASVNNALRWIMDNLPIFGQVAIARYLIMIRKINFNPNKTELWSEFSDNVRKYLVED